MYTIKQLCNSINVTSQSVYRLIRMNDDFRTLLQNGGRMKAGGGKFLYTDKALEWLKAYYGHKDAEAPVDLQQTEQTEAQQLRAELEAAQIALAETRKELEDARRELEEKDAERKAALEREAAVILLLSQEKAEKQALLPAPRKGLFARLFHR